MTLSRWPVERITTALAALPRRQIRSAAKDKSAAVLVPLCLDVHLRPAVLCCVRSTKLRSHAGEICFPGGRREAGDTDDAATALRETEEELGLSGQRVSVLGTMQPILSSGKIAVTPVVGLVAGDGHGGSLNLASLQLDMSEVSAAFTVDLQHLMDPATLVFHELSVPRKSVWVASNAIVFASIAWSLFKSNGLLQVLCKCPNEITSRLLFSVIVESSMGFV
eukprot:gnl/TRDRNA2_/TRDRNA2_167636_c0_seq3.p1 gnl/TRDRNA2_/TRDRNA2_167636_c0~~gnl/TRDRNA2_/TRDRNA2_167636_c0_seq3.p1  ORF type:complete len:222 (-),score=31.24 gnl/TRDRNA2_/TRDRNA2_167636_c0_seq3:4-669(-)